MSALAGAARSPYGFIYKSITDRASGLTRPGKGLAHVLAWAYGSVSVFKTDVVVKRKVSNPRSKPPKGGRGVVSGFSAKSARRLLFVARNVQGLTGMITLTYPADFPCDGRIVKRDLAAFRKWLARRGLGGLWWLEFQKRGAPHLHLYVNGYVDRRAVSAAWYRIVGSGDPRHLKAGTNTAAIRKPYAVAAYAAKYCKKAEQKEVPAGFSDVGRFWGLFGGLKVEPIWSVSGMVTDIAPVLRVIKRIDLKERLTKGLLPRRDTGGGSFTLYDLSRKVPARVRQC